MKDPPLVWWPGSRGKITRRHAWGRHFVGVILDGDFAETWSHNINSACGKRIWRFLFSSLSRCPVPQQAPLRGKVTAKPMPIGDAELRAKSNTTDIIAHAAASA